MKILAVGDVVGYSGTEYIRKNLWGIIKEYGIDFTVVNGENSAVGNGIDAESAQLLLTSGADVVTTGNHVWKKMGFDKFLDDSEYVLRPANYPENCPGIGSTVFKTAKGIKVLVICLMGNVYMPETLESPFERVDRILKKTSDYDVAVVDIHAEATSEKIALAKYLDGRVSVVFGTHTHVQTNDAKVLPKGTGYVTDLGMTGAYDSILGVENEKVIDKFLTKRPVRFEQASGDAMFNGVVFEVDEKTGKTLKTELVNIIP